MRVDGDSEVQRIAAIRYRRYQTGVVALDRQGLVTRSCMVNGTFSHFISPLENWTSMLCSARMCHGQGERDDHVPAHGRCPVSYFMLQGLARLVPPMRLLGG